MLSVLHLPFFAVVHRLLRQIYESCLHFSCAGIKIIPVSVDPLLSVLHPTFHAIEDPLCCLLIYWHIVQTCYHNSILSFIEVIPVSINPLFSKDFLSIKITVGLPVFFPEIRSAVRIKRCPVIYIQIHIAADPVYPPFGRALPHGIRSFISTRCIILCYPLIPLIKSGICQIVCKPVSICIDRGFIPGRLDSVAECLCNISLCFR